MTALAGIAAALALSVIIGVLLEVDPTLSEMASRARVGLGDILVALASGGGRQARLEAGVAPQAVQVGDA